MAARCLRIGLGVMLAYDALERFRFSELELLSKGRPALLAALLASQMAVGVCTLGLGFALNNRCGSASSGLAVAHVLHGDRRLIGCTTSIACLPSANLSPWRLSTNNDDVARGRALRALGDLCLGHLSQFGPPQKYAHDQGSNGGGANSFLAPVFGHLSSRVVNSSAAHASHPT